LAIHLQETYPAKIQITPTANPPPRTRLTDHRSASATEPMTFWGCTGSGSRYAIANTIFERTPFDEDPTDSTGNERGIAQHVVLDADGAPCDQPYIER